MLIHECDPNVKYPFKLLVMSEKIYLEAKHKVANVDNLKYLPTHMRYNLCQKNFTQIHNLKLHTCIMWIHVCDPNLK